MLKRTHMGLVALLLSISACGEQARVTGSSGSETFGQWRPYEDPIDGVRAKSRYRLSSEDMRGFITLMCVEGHSLSLFTFSEAVALETPIEATLRFDTGTPEKHDFLIPASDAAALYKTGSSADSVAFRQLLDGHKKVAIRIDSMLGIPITEEPFVFDLSGVDRVNEKLQSACPA